MADINGRSFSAKLLSTTGGGIYPVSYLKNQNVADNGWLIQDTDNQRYTPLRFDFIEARDDRLHYNISAAEGSGYAGAKLGVSRNGYLGFYSVANVSDFWKIELEGDPHQPDIVNFLLRDAQGHRVASVSERIDSFWFSMHPVDRFKVHSFLNVERGDIVHFQAQILRYL